MHDMEEKAKQVLKHTVLAFKALQDKDTQNPVVTIEIEDYQASIEWQRGNITVDYDTTMSRLERKIEEEFKQSSESEPEEYLDSEAESFQSPLNSESEEKQESPSSGMDATGVKDKILGD